MLAVLCHPGFSLSQGSARSWALSPASCAPGPVVLESGSGLRNPLLCGASAGAAPELLRGHAGPSPGEPPPEPPPSCSRFHPCQCCNPLGSSAAGCGMLSQGRRSSVSVPGRLGASPHLLGSCSNSLRAPFHLGRLVKPLLLLDGAFLGLSYPGGTCPGLSPAPQPGSSQGSSPLDAFCFFISFFPCLPPLIEA